MLDKKITCFFLFSFSISVPQLLAAPYKDLTLNPKDRVEDLLSRMTHKEKPVQWVVDTGADIDMWLYPRKPLALTENKRLGIPTFFPVTMARGASWNRNLEYRMHNAIGREVAALKANNLASPTINLLRHPGWGHVQETYGEDTFHLGEMAVSAIKGTQDHTIALLDIGSARHQAIALEAARESITLLKNENNALPLKRSSASRILVLGNTANILSLGDLGSSVVASSVGGVTPLQGIKNQSGITKVSSYTGFSTFAAKLKSLRADTMVVVASLNPWMEGQWIEQLHNFMGIDGDRRDLSLNKADVKMIKAAVSTGKKVIVVVQGGSAVTMEDWVDDVDAVVMAWYPGIKGGTAIAEVLFGDINPSGKTPLSWPKSESQRYTLGSLMPEVDYGFFQGYRYYDYNGLDPLFAFGHGLSYTHFSYQNMSQKIIYSAKNNDESVVRIGFDLSNTGSREGAEVAQIYLGYGNSVVPRAIRNLKGFEKIMLEAGESHHVVIDIPFSELKYYDVKTESWIIEDIDYRIDIGSSSRDISLSTWISI